MESLLGRKISKYQIVEQLGQGGMAVVYKAFDTSLERYVAVKLIRKEAIGEAYYSQMFQRFEREAKTLASLDHPNIVTIFDYGEYQGSPYLVEKFIPGGPLVLEGRPMPIAQAARLLAPIARALEYSHLRGIIHRDIKPSNILLGENGTPMLSDFGIAKILDASGLSTDSFVTSTGMQVGTPSYMAPEQWQGKPTTQSDIYGLGVILYELVTGRRPYVADSPAALMIKQVTEPLASPRQFVPDLPKTHEGVILKAMAVKLEDRYPTMGEFAASLEQLAASETSPKPASPPSVFGNITRIIGAKGESKPTDKIRRGDFAPTVAEKIPEQTVAPARFEQAKRFRVSKPIWIAGSGATLTGLILLSVWLATGNPGLVRGNQPHTPTSTTVLVIGPTNAVSTTTATPSSTVTPSVTVTLAPTNTSSPTASPTETSTLQPSVTQRPSKIVYPTNTYAPPAQVQPTAVPATPVPQPPTAVPPTPVPPPPTAEPRPPTPTQA